MGCAMMAFPRFMITVVGIAVLTILILAGRDAFPHHARMAEAIAAAIGVALNLGLQQLLWARPVSR
jgi:hypothetical protein